MRLGVITSSNLPRVAKAVYLSVLLGRLNLNRSMLQDNACVRVILAQAAAAAGYGVLLVPASSSVSFPTGYTLVSDDLEIASVHAEGNVISIAQTLERWRRMELTTSELNFGNT